MTIYQVTLEARAYMLVLADSPLQAERIADRFSYDATVNFEPYFEAATVEIADETYDPCDTLYYEKGVTHYVPPEVVVNPTSYVFGASAASPSNF